MEKDIKIFYHVYLTNNYVDIITEQLTHIFYSKLYQACKNFHIGVVGNEYGKEWLTNIVKNYSKIKLHYFDNGDETDTLKLIPLLSNHNDYILYLHTKGITHVNDTPQHLWRKLLSYKTINEWKECIHELSNYDCVGPLYRENTYLGYYPHFSGNFWWTKYNYILTLDSSFLDKNYIHGRMGAEFWIGSNPSAKMKCVYNYDFHQEPFFKEFTINEYINE